MNNHDHTAFNSGDNKGSKRTALRNYLRTHTVSRWMAAEALDMPLQTVCWIVGDLRKMDAVAVVEKSHCRISGEMVEYITTDPEKFPKSNQLILPLQ